MKSYYVYILKCEDGTYFTGFTSNLELQLEAHRLGKRKDLYTYGRGTVSLVFQTKFNLASMALEAKKQIKRWSSTKKEALINGEFEKLSSLT